MDSCKIRRARQLGLPVVDVEYVHQYRSVSSSRLPIDINQFIIKTVKDQENFQKTGTISLEGMTRDHF